MRANMRAKMQDFVQDSQTMRDFMQDSRDMQDLMWFAPRWVNARWATKRSRRSMLFQLRRLRKVGLIELVSNGSSVKHRIVPHFQKLVHKYKKLIRRALAADPTPRLLWQLLSENNIPIAMTGILANILTDEKPAWLRFVHTEDAVAWRFSQAFGSYATVSGFDLVVGVNPDYWLETQARRNQKERLSKEQSSDAQITVS